MILGSSNCNLTNYFGVIVKMWLALFLGCYKWYLNNLVIPCDTHGTGLGKEDVKDLSGGDSDTLEKLVPMLGR
jgi:hypothetical protein